jgi:hypothetical protein
MLLRSFSSFRLFAWQRRNVSVTAAVTGVGVHGGRGYWGPGSWIGAVCCASHLAKFASFISPWLSVCSFVIDLGGMPPVRACFSLLRLCGALMVVVDFGGGKLVVYDVLC